MKHVDPKNLVTGVRADRADLAAAVAFVARASEKRDNIPILSNLAMQERNGALILSATDLDLLHRVELDTIAIGAGFATTVPARMLSDMVKKQKAEAVAIEPMPEHESPEGGIVRLAFGSSTMKLNSLPVTDFPTLEEGEYSHRFGIGLTDLRSALARVEFAISTEETRYYLNGVYLHYVKDGLTGGKPALVFVATDGHRLAKVAIPAPDGSENMPGVIIPRKTVGEVIKACKMKAIAGSVMTIHVCATKIKFRAGRYTILSKLIDGTFPDYERVIPNGNDKKAVLGRKELIALIEGVSVVASKNGRAVRFDFEQKPVYGVAAVTATMVNPDTGTSQDSIPCDYDSKEPLQIGFNGRYLLDILDKVSSDKVRLRLSDPGSPTLIDGTDADDCDVLFVQMPMRV